MKKTLIYPIKISLPNNKTIYQAGENIFKDYLDKAVIFPLNHVVLNDIAQDDEILVILVETTHPKREETKEYVSEAKDEINSILEGHCKSFEFKVIEIPYASTKDQLGQIYKSLCAEIIPSSSLCVDFTFGQKYLPIILFCVLNYAEKYLECTINRLVYGLYDPRSEEHTILDFTTLYLLNSFGAMFDGSKSSFDTFVGKILK